MSHSRRNGFTLVELLVVITIIGMLMALLLPAVGAATENARSLKCKNRVKQVATAMASYESRFESFPGYTNAVEVQGSQDRHLPWLVAIMGDMERQDILDQWKRDDLSDADLPRPFLDFLTCPSDPPILSPSGPQTHTSYVGNVGNAARDLAGCGLMHTKYPFRQKNGKKMAHTTSSLDKLAAGDGASMTIMVTENIQSSYWEVPAYANTQRTKPLLASVKSGEPSNVFVWHDGSPQEEWLINGPTQDRTPTPGNARPSSEHKGGVNVAFADGHVVFMKKDVDYSVYTRLMSSDGKKCGIEFQKNNNKAPLVNHAAPLSDADYK